MILDFRYVIGRLLTTNCFSKKRLLYITKILRIIDFHNSISNIVIKKESTYNLDK